MRATTNNQILDVLQYSIKEYEDQYFNWFEKYCYSISNKDISIFFQTFHNAYMSKWFIYELKKVDQNFLEMYHHLPKNVIYRRNHYKMMISQIFDLKPSALLSEIKPNPMFKFGLNLN